jgi:fatty acid/phospholipid biosynthesis enzyme
VVDHAEAPVLELDEGDVEGAAAEVVDEPVAVVGVGLPAAAMAGGDGLLEELDAVEKPASCAASPRRGRTAGARRSRAR